MKKIDVLIFAKALYKDKELLQGTRGMCYCLNKVLHDQEEFSCPYYRIEFIGYSTLLHNFPEFNPKYFKSTASIYEYWWDVKDTESRLKAFDTLIELYKNNTENFT